MSNKLTNGFYVKLSALAIMAASLSITALPGAQAQSIADASSPTTASGGSTAGATTTTSTTGDAGASSTTGTAAPTSDIPPGVLWTDPKYAVKEVAAPVRVAVPTAKQPTTGTAATKVATPVDNSGTYDEKEASEFANAAGLPQYLWNRQSSTTKGQKDATAELAKEVKAYHRMLVEKFVANMSVPNSATLVENSTTNYLYLVSFTIDAKGKINNVNSVKSFGPLNAVNLADDNENALMTSSVKGAISKCSPVKLPPSGVAPWYMLLKYEPNSGKVFVTNVNAI
jgi:hypothetical protein